MKEKVWENYEWVMFKCEHKDIAPFYNAKKNDHMMVVKETCLGQNVQVVVPTIPYGTLKTIPKKFLTLTN